MGDRSVMGNLPEEPCFHRVASRRNGRQAEEVSVVKSGVEFWAVQESREAERCGLLARLCLYTSGDAEDFISDGI
jgi:hypothetical protein